MTDKAVDQPDFFYEDRFLESWVGSIISDPSTAIVELVANCWDAYATDVNITWPDKRNNRPFSISDNGKGMDRRPCPRERTQGAGDAGANDGGRAAAAGRAWGHPPPCWV